MVPLCFAKVCQAASAGFWAFMARCVNTQTRRRPRVRGRRPPLVMLGDYQVRQQCSRAEAASAAARGCGAVGEVFAGRHHVHDDHARVIFQAAVRTQNGLDDPARCGLHARRLPSQATIHPVALPVAHRLV